MKRVRSMSQVELAAYIQSRLEKSGIKVVLSGGAAVAMYSSNKYVSFDLDLINVDFEDRKKVKAVMTKIGFHEKGRNFVHPDTDFTVEFPGGPLAVGHEQVKRVRKKRLATGILTVISPTDCVKDRLACYYHWNDMQCLSQAILVARTRKINLVEIRAWSLREGKLDVFNKIRKSLKSQKSRARSNKSRNLL